MRGKYTTQDLIKVYEHLKIFNSANHTERGITRLAYSPEDEAAHQYLIEEMRNHGLIVRQDAMGNIFARLPGKNSNLPAVGTGSHIDTVPNGGALDGALGVFAGIFALLQFSPGELERDLELVVFRAEESSRFGVSCIGSKTMVGHLASTKYDENMDDNGVSIRDAIKNAGYRHDALSSCELQQDYFDSFVELHIEQGRCLEQEQKTIGVVYGIAAPTRFEVNVLGQADHSGATPMGIRSDALVAAADIIENLHISSCKESANGTVGTVGKINCYPNSMNVIPGQVKFYVDIRGVEKPSIERVVDSLYLCIQKAKFDHNVKIELRTISEEEPVLLNSEICDLIEETCSRLKLSNMRMVSGAGHDAMYIAKKFSTAMIFVPSIDGISHHPNEESKKEHILSSAFLLAETLKNLANKK